MRKHFLLLFLMALLPLAGWATQITDDHVTVVNPFYGHVPTYVGTFAANVVVDGYYADENESISKTATEVRAANAGTEFYVKFHATGLDGTLTRKFTIQKMPLTLIIGKTTQRSKTYGGEEPTAANYNSYIESVKDADNNDLKTALQASIVVGREAGEDVLYNNVPEVIGYAYTATISNNNYTIGEISSDGTFKINPKSLSTATIADIAAVTYKGSEWKPTPAVKFGTATPLTKGTDYTLSYTNATDAHAYNHATLAPTVTATGKGNYTGTVSKTFTINPAPLFVMPYAEKEYNYSADVPATPKNLNNAKLQYTFQGFVDAMKASDVAIELSGDDPVATWASATATKNVGSYPLAFTNDDINTAFTLANYTFIALEGTFKITAKAANVTAQSYPSFKYGDPENFALLTDLADVVANATDVTPLSRAIKIEKATTPEASGTHAGEFKLTPKERTDAEIAEVINADAGIAAADKAAAIEAAVIARDNYKVNGTAGYLKINQAPLYIGLKESAYTLNKTYDGEEVSLDLIKSAAGVTVVGLKNNETIDYSKLSLAVDDNDSKVGFYTIRLSGNGIINDNYDITFIPSQFEIKQKTLKVTAYDQVFVVNATIPANLNNLYKIDATDGLVEGDDVSEVFKLAFVDGANGVNCVTTAKVGNATDGPTANAFSADPLKFTAVPSNAFVHETVNYNTGWAAGVLAGGITFVASDADPTKTKWGNYKVVITKGKVTVVADGEATFVLDDSKDLTTVVGADKNNATVTFTSRPLYAETWNAMVLPFAIAVKDLAAAFDYAVVDVLDTDASDGNVHFRLKVSGTIAANTPFLIYPCGTYNNLNQVIFTHVNVKKVSETAPVADGGGNKFIGVYKAQSIFGSDKLRYIGSDGKFYGTTKYTSESPAIIKPLRAYLDLTGSTSARPTIFIEEPDGSTTAISTINADGVAVPAQGWYTINGMKLEGMPTEKGIYINNGKKIVIK